VGTGRQAGPGVARRQGGACVTPVPALCPVRGLSPRLPLDRAPSLRLLLRRQHRLCSEVSTVLRTRPTPQARASSASPAPASRRDPGPPERLRVGMRSPRFRRDPFVRDGVFDHGRAAAPRMTVLLMLPSAVSTASAPATGIFRGSIAHPTRSLCTLRHGRRLPRRNTRYQAGATPYLGRSSTGWITPAFLAHGHNTNFPPSCAA
jgi:hypothetical protein